MRQSNSCRWPSSSSSSSSSACLCVVLFIWSGISAVSASSLLTGDIFGDRASIGRNLLQAKKACPVNFEFQNYTIIISKCKGPHYLANLCCPALKEFACPFAAELNDLSNDCASIMFSYINLYGKYPPGIFASECQEGKEGLACPAPSPSQLADVNGSQITYLPSPLLIFIAGFVVVLYQLF